MMEKVAIHGKVARILNSREVALNIGSESGVELNMYFDIMDRDVTDVLDPDTGAVLGSVQLTKVRVKVIRLEEKISIASTFRKKRINVGGRGLVGGAFAEMLRPPSWITKYETLKIDDRTREEIDEMESYVKVGDPVVQCTGVPEENLVEF